jgi:hypothetical protein
LRCFGAHFRLFDFTTADCRWSPPLGAVANLGLHLQCHESAPVDLLFVPAESGDLCFGSSVDLSAVLFSVAPSVQFCRALFPVRPPESACASVPHFVPHRFGPGHLSSSSVAQCSVPSLIWFFPPVVLFRSFEQNSPAGSHANAIGVVHAAGVPSGLRCSRSSVVWWSSQRCFCLRDASSVFGHPRLELICASSLGVSSLCRFFLLRGLGSFVCSASDCCSSLNTCCLLP